MDLPIQLVVAYSIFSLFLFYQKLHLKNFQGASEYFSLALSVYVFIAIIYGLGFLIYWGIYISWIHSGILFLIAFTTQLLWFLIEAKMGLRNHYWVISTVGFVVLPIAGYFMWTTIP